MARPQPALLVSKAEFRPDRTRLQCRNQIIGKSSQPIQGKRPRPRCPAAEQAGQHTAGGRDQGGQHLLAVAGAQRRAEVTDTVRETFEIPAGGVRLEGRVGDVRIPTGQISFDIYPGSQFDTSNRRPLAQNVLTGDVVLLPEGTYYIVSNYGDANSTVRSDIRVVAGKLTDATINHRAAIITLKLVNERGGEARANTQWSVLTPGGDVIKESIGAFPRVILAEGEYRAIARNDDKTYEGAFRVVNGVDGEVEVIAR